MKNIVDDHPNVAILIIIGLVYRIVSKKHTEPLEEDFIQSKQPKVAYKRYVNPDDLSYPEQIR